MTRINTAEGMTGRQEIEIVDAFIETFLFCESDILTMDADEMRAEYEGWEPVDDVHPDEWSLVARAVSAFLASIPDEYVDGMDTWSVGSAMYWASQHLNAGFYEVQPWDVPVERVNALNAAAHALNLEIDPRYDTDGYVRIF